MKHRFRNNLLYYLLVCTGSLVLILPYRMALLLGKMLGAMAYYFAARDRKIAIDNLTSVFGNEKSPREIKSIAKKVFVNLGVNTIEFAFLKKTRGKNIDDIVTVEGFEHAENAFAKGRGIVACSAHFGNWELIAVYFALKGFPVNVIARKIRFEKFNEMLNNARRANKINVLDRDDAFKQAIRHLKNNEVIAVLGDQDVRALDGVFVDFFGRKAYTPSGPAVMAMLSKAAMLPILILRDGYKHKIILQKPVELPETGDRKKDILIMTQRYSDAIALYIRKYPEHWVWMHKRWNTKEQGASN